MGHAGPQPEPWISRKTGEPLDLEILADGAARLDPRPSEAHLPTRGGWLYSSDDETISLYSRREGVHDDGWVGDEGEVFQCRLTASGVAQVEGGVARTWRRVPDEDGE